MKLLRLLGLLLLCCQAFGAATTTRQIDNINSTGGSSLSVPTVGTKFLTDTATQTLGAGSTWNGVAVGAAYGGTGSTSLTANNVLLGNGTSALQVVAPSTSGNVLTSNGTTWTSAAPTGGSGAPVKMVLSGGVTPWTTIDGFHRVRSSVTLTTVDISMGNCSATGTVVVGIIKNGTSAATATLTSSAGTTCTTEQTVSVALVSGDVVSIDVNSSSATGEDLTVELLGI